MEVILELASTKLRNRVLITCQMSYCPALFMQNRVLPKIPHGIKFNVVHVARLELLKTLVQDLILKIFNNMRNLKPQDFHRTLEVCSPELKKSSA